MIEKIITFSIRNKIIVGLFVMTLVGVGIYSLKTLPIDAVPDITNNQVQIISIAPTLAANEVEQCITSPIELSLANIPHKTELRSISRLGLSVVTVVFEDAIDMYWARQQISERLKEAEELMPKGLTHPELAPISTGLSEIYQYILKVDPAYEHKYSLLELRTIQDWIVKREMMGTEGVADINSYGGYLQEFEVAVNPEQLRAQNISLLEIFSALEKNNQNTGSAYIEKKPQAFFIRGLGLINSLEDIENIVVKNTAGGTPVLVGNLAKVQMGHAPRYGAFVVDTTGEAVGGVVMMLKGKNASEVIEGIKEKVKLIEKSLPEGISIQPYYDRTSLIHRALDTVSKNLLEGGLIVILILVLLLGNLRAGLIVASVIPLSMLFAVSLMKLFGVSGNLMSLGAIDFGLIVDGAVIIVERIVHSIAYKSDNQTNKPELSQEKMDATVLGATKKMMSSATFGQIIIFIVYLPILALIGIEGKMFRPMAETVIFAILGALILSLTYIPVASSLFLSKKTPTAPGFSDRMMNFLKKGFHPLINFSIRNKLVVVASAFVLFLMSVFLFNSLGGEFIPTLEEGDLASGVMTLQGGSLTNTIESVNKANRILMTRFPEVKHAVCKIGTGEIPTDPTPMETGDYIIVMKDKKDWVSAGSREEMMEKMQEALSELKGVVFTLQQPIQMRFNELMTGSKQDVAVKIFGDNLDTLEAQAYRVETLLRNVKGIEELNVEKVTGSGQVQVSYNRKQMARYGLNISDINLHLKTAFAGSSAGVIYDEEKRFDLVVRYDSAFRNNPDCIQNLYIPMENGTQIPLRQLADITIKTGLAQVSRENTKRRITISFNVRNRDVQSVIHEIQEIIEQHLGKKPGYFITYGGQFENMVEANKRLSIAVPFALLLISLMLYFAFKSIKSSLLILSAVPFAMIGGVFALYFRGMNFSISAGVGFIALFGVAVLNGIVLLTELNRLKQADPHAPMKESVQKAINSRFRPVVITALVASLGFLPMAISGSAGAEVQKPLATVVIGGLISSSLLTLIVLPVLYLLFNEKSKKKWWFQRPSKTPKICAILFFTLLSAWVHGQQKPGVKKINLREAEQLALSGNFDIQQANQEIQYFRKLQRSKPEIENLNFSYEFGQINSLQQDNGFSITQKLPSIIQHAAQWQLAAQLVKNADLLMQAKQSECLYSVKTLYFQALYLQSKEIAAREKLHIYRQLLHGAEVKTRVGESTQLEENGIKSRCSMLEWSYSRLVTEKESALKRLALLLNSNNPIELQDSILYQYKKSLPPDIFQPDYNPHLLIAQQDIRIKEKEWKIEKLDFLPTFGIGYFNQSNKEIANKQRLYGFQLDVSIPLILYPKSGKIKAAGIKKQMAEAFYEQQLKEVKDEYSILLHELSLLQQKVAYYEHEGLALANSISNQAQKSYEKGEIAFTEWVQHMDLVSEIRESYLESLLLFNITYFEIEKQQNYKNQ